MLEKGRRSLAGAVIVIVLVILARNEHEPRTRSTIFPTVQIIEEDRQHGRNTTMQLSEPKQLKTLTGGASASGLAAQGR